jgi:magnesium chelatase family protein
MLATARTFALLGVEALAVDAEVDINRGLPSFSLVGLPDAAVRESRERVRAAIANSGFDFPQKRITANLAPADLR